MTAAAFEEANNDAYLLFERKVIEDFDEFSIVDKLSTTQFLSPNSVESVTFANSLRVKLLGFGTATQTEMKPQQQQHLALMLHRQ